ncbi:hypothetical protein EV363DRAFT_1463400 [Boletus edulis]|nr:hypothetical protein EV363DRAFT_1463400 [Boletus edulis]
MPRIASIRTWGPHTCRQCGRGFPTPSGVCRHIAHSARCHAGIEADDPGQRVPTHHDENDGNDGNVLPTSGEDVEGPDLASEHQPVEMDTGEDREVNPDAEEEPNSEKAYFPRHAMEFTEHPVGAVFDDTKTSFQVMQDIQEAAGRDTYAPFRDAEEWELAEWLIKNVNQQGMEDFLKLPITRNRTQPSYHSKYLFMKAIDQLPTGPEWSCELIQVHGDAVLDEPMGNVEADGEDDAEELELWLRDPVACIRELISNPTFKDDIAYAPEKVYADPQGQTRRYDEMWTGDWWWETQRRMPAGATIAPVILASDKTELS